MKKKAQQEETRSVSRLLWSRRGRGKSTVSNGNNRALINDRLPRSTKLSMKLIWHEEKLNSESMVERKQKKHRVDEKEGKVDHRAIQGKG